MSRSVQRSRPIPSLYRLSIRSIIQQVYDTHTHDEQMESPDNCRICGRWSDEQEDELYLYYSQLPTVFLVAIWSEAETDIQTVGRQRAAALRMCFTRMFLGQRIIHLAPSILQFAKTELNAKATAFIYSVILSRCVITRSLINLQLVYCEQRRSTSMMTTISMSFTLTSVHLEYINTKLIISVIQEMTRSLLQLKVLRLYVASGENVTTDNALLHWLSATSSSQGCLCLQVSDSGVTVSENSSTKLLTDLKPLRSTGETKVDEMVLRNKQGLQKSKPALCRATGNFEEVQLLSADKAMQFSQQRFEICKQHVANWGQDRFNNALVICSPLKMQHLHTIIVTVDSPQLLKDVLKSCGVCLNAPYSYSSNDTTKIVDKDLGTNNDTITLLNTQSEALVAFLLLAEHDVSAALKLLM